MRINFKWITFFYIFMVYSFIPLARPMLAFLEEATGVWFDVSILLTYLIFILGTLGYLKFFQKEKRIWPYAGVIGMGFILALCLNQIYFIAEKIHFLQYAILGILLIYALEQKTLKVSPVSKSLFVMGAGFVIGLGDEMIQGLIPKRFFDWRDIAMNIFGVALGIGFTFVIQPRIVVKSEERRVKKEGKNH